MSPAHEFQDTLSHTGTSSLVSLNANTQSSNVSAVICHILASRSDSPNAFGSKIPVYTALKINGWEDLLLGYHDKIVVEFLNYGWPINYCASQSPHFTICNHPSALAFPDHVRHYIQTELSFAAIAGPFSTNPLHKPLVCSPLQTVPKRGSSKRRVVLDLSFPPTFPVNTTVAFHRTPTWILHSNSDYRASTVCANSWLKDGVVVFTKKTFNALIASFRST